MGCCCGGREAAPQGSLHGVWVRRVGKRSPGEGRGHTRGLERPRRLLPAAGHVLGARAAGGRSRKGRGREGHGSLPVGSSSARAAPANQSAETPHRPRPAGKPRPHARSGMGDTDTGHGHGTDRLLSAMDESEH